MVKHVNQFPNDQECQRYCNTLQDIDLAVKVEECLKVIVDAKAKQAEQANLAAQSLLEQLAEEEALAESKKQSKKRLKEKKKAKKLAKKQLETAEDAVEEVPVPEPVKVVEPEPTPSVKPTKPKNETGGKQKKKNLPVVEMQKEESPELVADESRVPVVHEIPTHQENGPSSVTPTNKTNNQQRRQNRGRRNEQG